MKQQYKKLVLPLLCILLCCNNQKTQAINPLLYSFTKKIVLAQKASIAAFCIQYIIKKIYYESLSQSEQAAEKTSLEASTSLTPIEQKKLVARIIKKRPFYEEELGKEKTEKIFSLVNFLIDSDQYIHHELTTHEKLSAYADITHNNSKIGYIKRAINWTVSTGIFMLHSKYGPNNKVLCLATFLGTYYITSIIEDTIASYKQKALVKKYIQSKSKPVQINNVAHDLLLQPLF